VDGTVYQSDLLITSFEWGCRWCHLFSLIFIHFVFYPESSLVLSGVQHLVLSYVFTFVVLMFGSFLPEDSLCLICAIIVCLRKLVCNTSQFYD
jgi:hypothetical protein